MFNHLLYYLLILVLNIVLSVQPSTLPAEYTLSLIVVDLDSHKIIKTLGDCITQESPCSTFKIALSLMGFDANILENATEPEWPYKDEFDAKLALWQQPHTPLTWIQNSCVWYSQNLISLLGIKNFQKYISKFCYGNMDISGNTDTNDGLSTPWICSSLKISPTEQVKFIQKLLLNNLPVSQYALNQTKNLLYISEIARGWKMYGKTGCGTDNYTIKYWFVGWITNEEKNKSLIFASLIKTQQKDIAKIRNLCVTNTIIKLFE